MIRDIIAFGSVTDRDPTHATLVDIRMDNFVLYTHIILTHFDTGHLPLFRLPSCKTLPTRTSSSLYLTCRPSQIHAVARYWITPATLSYLVLFYEIICCSVLVILSFYLLRHDRMGNEISRCDARIQGASL